MKSSADTILLAQAQQYRAPQRQARISPAQVNQILLRNGYRRVSDIRYFRTNRGADYYLALGWHGGRQYQVQVSDETGRIARRQLVGARRGPGNDQALRRGLDRIEVRQALQRQGYVRITNVRYIGEVRNDHFVADAWQHGRHYRLRINDDNGRVISRRLIR
jgi:hypothetical protein